MPNPTSGDSIELTYYFPFIGSLRTKLTGDCARIYRFLQATGEIERLKDLDHLGLIRDAYEAAHHSRWEYAMLMMCLIDQIRENEKSHLEGDVQLTDTLKIDSALNLLKSWAMLSNVGHLPWTFVTERALMECLRGSKDYMSAFLKCIDKDIHTWLADRVQKNRVYNYHEVFSYVRLHSLALRYGNRTEGDHMQQLCRQVVRKFIVKEDMPSFVRIHHIFTRLRQIAYLGLDSFHTPVPLKLDLRQLLTDPEWLGKFVIPTLLSEQEDLKFLDAFYNANVYTSCDTLAAVAAKEGQLRKAISSRAEVLSQENPQQWVHPLVEELASGAIQRGISSIPLSDGLRLCLEESIATNEAAAADLVEVVWAAPPRHKYLQIHSKNDSRLSAGAFLRGFAHIEEMSRTFPHGKWHENDYLARINEDNAMELMEACLTLCLPRAQWWEWKNPGAGQKAIVAIAEEVNALLRDLPFVEDPSRFVEIQAARDLLTMLNGQVVVVALRQLTAWPNPRARANSDYGYQPAAEFDGVVIARVDSAISLYLIEAKSNSLELPLAKDGLRNRVHYLGARADRFFEQKMRGMGGYVCCNIRVNA